MFFHINRCVKHIFYFIFIKLYNILNIGIMTVQLSAEQQLKFSHIMYNSDGREHEQIKNLAPEQKSKLKSLYAQKIAYQAANANLKQQQAPAQPASHGEGGILSVICCCFMPDQNRDKFDIDSATFIKRVLSPFLFFRSNFYQLGQSKQLYGFLWLTISYVIVASIAANLNQYFIMPFNYKFSNDLMLKAIGISAIFLISQPFIYAGVVKCLKGGIQNIQSMMLCGYSLVLYFIPTFLCLIPSLYWHVGMLALCAFVRTIYLYRNYSTKVPQKNFVMLVVIGLMQALFNFTVLRLLFPNDNGYNISDGTQKVFKMSHFTSRVFQD